MIRFCVPGFEVLDLMKAFLLRHCLTANGIFQNGCMYGCTLIWIIEHWDGDFYIHSF